MKLVMENWRRYISEETVPDSEVDRALAALTAAHKASLKEGETDPFLAQLTGQEEDPPKELEYPGKARLQKFWAAIPAGVEALDAGTEKAIATLERALQTSSGQRLQRILWKVAAGVLAGTLAMSTAMAVKTSIDNYREGGWEQVWEGEADFPERDPASGAFSPGQLPG
jgi:hypothetical protein